EGETLGTLLTASYGFVNERLGQVYGVDIPGEEFVRVALDPSTRAGAFTQPYFLSVASNYDRTSPTLRGKLLEELLMCAAVPAPPPDIGLTPPTRDDVSNRQAYEIELADPACAACHALITYPGFIFENYDAIGSYQTTDNGFAVDASTDIYVDGEFVAYENAVAMMPDLAEREVVSSCVALNWVTYLVGRRSREAISGVGSREIESCGGG